MVDATLSDATGPQIHVTGTSGRLRPVTEVCGQQVDAVRMEERRGEERVLPVGQRGGRPLEEPEEERGVAAAAQRVGGGALSPSVHPQEEPEREVEHAGDHEGHPCATAASGSARV